MEQWFVQFCFCFDVIFIFIFFLSRVGYLCVIFWRGKAVVVLVDIKSHNKIRKEE